MKLSLGLVLKYIRTSSLGKILTVNALRNVQEAFKCVPVTKVYFQIFKYFIKRNRIFVRISRVVKISKTDLDWSLKKSCVPLPSTGFTIYAKKSNFCGFWILLLLENFACGHLEYLRISSSSAFALV